MAISSGPGGAAAHNDADIDPLIIQAASVWMARLWADDASAEDRTACARWRAEHPHHELAWQRMQAFESKLCSVPVDVARHTLREPAPSAYLNRRRALKLLGLMTTAGGIAYVTHSSDTWQLAMASQSTRTGEVRKIVLADGTQVVLASASAIDVQFDEQQRLIVLRAGEILVTTGHDSQSSARPFFVQSRHGTVQALGTVFSVRQDQDSSRVAVLEGAVEVRPQRAGSAALNVELGHALSFTSSTATTPVALANGVTAWVDGVLVADNMRLDELIGELARYRPGLLRCAPQVAQLRVSGVFSLRDTDRALQNLALALPIAVVKRTRFWVTVRAAD